MICRACREGNHLKCTGREEILGFPEFCYHTEPHWVSREEILKALAKSNEESKIESLEDTPE